jgi:FHA domain
MINTQHSALELNDSNQLAIITSGLPLFAWCQMLGEVFSLLKQVKKPFRNAAGYRHSAISARPVILVALIAFIISIVWTPAGPGALRIALASHSESQQAQSATATPKSSGNGAPTPVSTSANGPPAVGTAAPQPVGTGVVQNSTQPGATSSSSGGDFPWLIVLLLALIVLAGLAYVAMRQRSPVEVSAGPEVTNLRRRSDITGGIGSSQDIATDTDRQGAAETMLPPGDGEPVAPAAPSADEAAATAGATPAAGAEQAPTPVSEATSPVAPEAPEAPAATPTPVTPPFVVPAVGPTATPATVECANCGAANSTSEKFCHECGQDLRPQLAQLAAAAAAAAAPPVDVVEADTPYLETLDRVDEQLEFVLSRPRVVIGTAGGNDIVVDSAFKGWRTVSPAHAELRREQDGFTIIDRDSEYGTFVNEMRTGENILSDGDLVRLGDVRFIFRVPKVGE